MNYFKDKLIWITGASSGIGYEFATQLSNLGAKLILSARSEDKLDQFKRNAPVPENIYVVPLDMEDFDAIRSTCKKVLKEIGTVDMLFCNAGMSQRSVVSETVFEVDERLIRLNLLSHILQTKCLLPSMKKQGFGHFVVISSVAGKLAAPLRSAYCASKHGLHGFFETVRLEEEDSGIKVTMIVPGYVSTSVASNSLTSDGSQQGKTDDSMKGALSPELLVRKVLRKVKKGKFEAYIGKIEILGIYIKRLFPTLIHYIVKRRKY